MFVYFLLAIALCASVVYLFSAGGARRTVKELFYGNYYAERGVLSPDDKPNSLEAFMQCINNGIGIKTEVCMSKDRKLIISSSNRISDTQTVSETDSEILLDMGYITLTQLLDAVDGKVPVILELIVGEQNEKLCRYTADAIIAYKHKNIAVTSFHSGIVGWFKTSEKDIFRGVISAPASDFKSLSKLDKFLVGNMGNNYICRPQFVLYRNKPESFIVKFVYKLGIIKGVWTVDNPQDGKKFEETKDMIVFKNFVPENPHYKDLPVMYADENTATQQDDRSREIELKEDIIDSDDLIANLTADDIANDETDN